MTHPGFDTRGGARAVRVALMPRHDPSPVSALGLRLVAEPGRPLTKAQKKFDRLLRKVEALRAQQIRETARWDRFVKLYQELIHPEEQRMAKRRKDVVLLLVEHWREPRGLGPRQRDQLADFLRAQLRELSGAGGDLFDAELKKLWDALHPKRARDEEAAEESDAEDPEAPREEDDTEPEAETWEANETEAGDAGASASSGPKSSARVALREELRKRTVVGIYKQLAKVLHPDLEQDPALRERKHTLMQELTKAHREGDLHTLLRLELEWINREQGDLARLGDEKLAIYLELLEEQVDELQAAVREIPYAPRFAAVARFLDPISGAPLEAEEILGEIRRMSTSLKQFRDVLAGPGALRELREVLRQFGEEQRRQARGGDFFDELF